VDNRLRLMVVDCEFAATRNPQCTLVTGHRFLLIDAQSVLCRSHGPMNQDRKRSRRLYSKFLDQNYIRVPHCPKALMPQCDHPDSGTHRSSNDRTFLNSVVYVLSPSRMNTGVKCAVSMGSASDYWNIYMLRRRTCIVRSKTVCLWIPFPLLATMGRIMAFSSQRES
jgi:hypothetical protein